MSSMLIKFMGICSWGKFLQSPLPDAQEIWGTYPNLPNKLLQTMAKGKSMGPTDELWINLELIGAP